MTYALAQLAILVLTAAFFAGGLYFASRAVLAWRRAARTRTDLPLQWHRAECADCDDLDRWAARASAAAQVHGEVRS